jgi:hypothetical protein
VALAAYAAFKLRERAQAGKGGPPPRAAIEPMFLERYMPDVDDVEPPRRTARARWRK